MVTPSQQPWIVLVVTCSWLAACVATKHPSLANAMDRLASGHLRSRLHRSLQQHSEFLEVDLVGKDSKDFLTLSRAKIIHQVGMQVVNDVQRENGHFYSYPKHTTSHQVPDRSCKCDSSAATLFLPVDFGADPTGQHDSTIAFEMMMTKLLNSTGRSNRHMGAGIVDLGGVTIDLQGGRYLLSSPIVIPPMLGNAHIIDGELVASGMFPEDRWLIEFGNGDECNPLLPDGRPDQQQSCNQFLSATNVFLDANLIAAGGIRTSKVMGATLMNIFVTGFRQIGILVSDGHSTMISNTWMGACYWSNATICRRDESVGILLHGYDNYVTNTIVFDYAKVGVQVAKGANILEGVHTWNGGGRGIVLGSNSTPATSARLIGCYLDYQTLDIWDPSDVLVESTFFYHGYAIIHAGASQHIHGLTMRMNHYSTNQSVVLDGAFRVTREVSLQDETNWAKTTKVSKSLTLANSNHWHFDFPELLLPAIDHVTYSVVSSSPIFFSHMARPPNGTSVSVDMSDRVNATVYMTVEQGI